MQVPSPCCKSCGYRISPFQAPFRRMRMGMATPEDIFWYLNLNKPNLTYRELYIEFDNLARQGLNNEQIFEKLKLKKEDFYQFETHLQEEIRAEEFFNRKGITRLCCMERIEHPPIVPVFNATVPKGSIIEINKGLQSRLLYRNPGDHQYTSMQVYKEDIDNLTGDIENEDVTGTLDAGPSAGTKIKTTKKKAPVLVKASKKDTINEQIDELDV